MVDSLYQGFGVGAGGTHNAILSSEEYLSQAQRTLNNIEDGFYISPPFLDKISIHVAKNFLDLPKIKVPLILGVPSRLPFFPASYMACLMYIEEGVLEPSVNCNHLCFEIVRCQPHRPLKGVAFC